MPSTLVTLQSSDPSNPAVVAATIIDGDVDNDGTSDGKVISCGSTSNENCVVNGLTLVNGYGQYGGGMNIYYCSPIVSNCVFQ